MILIYYTIHSFFNTNIFRLSILLIRLMQRRLVKDQYKYFNCKSKGILCVLSRLSPK
jgi:hypothetical protein